MGLERTGVDIVSKVLIADSGLAVCDDLEGRAARKVGV